MPDVRTTVLPAGTSSTPRALKYRYDGMTMHRNRYVSVNVSLVIGMLYKYSLVVHE